MNQLVKVSRHGAIGLVALDNPPVNALSQALRAALLQALGELFVDADVAAIVIACEGRTFVAGADIREFGKPPKAPDVPEVVEFVAAAPKPVIAALHGTALGGGLELALACHYRVATESTKLGLPEVTLGILPGAGGTQRLPRLVGVEAALELIVSGQPIGAGRARELGLVDELIEGELRAGALAFATRIAEARRPLPRVHERSAVSPDAQVIFDFEQRARERFRGFLAPFSCIRAVRAAVELPFAAGLTLERELFRELMASSEAKAQQHAFFAERLVARVPGLPEDTKPRPIGKVAVCGSGALAAALVKGFASARIPVTTFSPADWRDLEPGAHPTLSREELRSADLLLEATGGTPEVAREALAMLAAVARPGAIMATTTAGADLSATADAIERPHELVGLNFVRWFDAPKVIEAVRTHRTAPDVIAAVMRLAKTLGALAVPVRGSVLSELVARQQLEALFLVEEGALPEQVDRVLYDFGFPVGPFASGVPAPLPRPEARRRVIDDQEILERCLYAVVNEAARLIDADVARPHDIDLLCIHGAGFPVYRGGPLFHADQVGVDVVYHAIVRYQRQLGSEHFTPAPLFERLLAQGKGFYREASSSALAS
jgi:3-hydroxyacyl-CoA dehydrogenase